MDRRVGHIHEWGREQQVQLPASDSRREEGVLTGTSIALVALELDEAATAPFARSSGDEAAGDMRACCRPFGGAEQAPILSELCVQA